MTVKHIALYSILPLVVLLNFSSCGYSLYREFKPMNANKIKGKKDLHPIFEERELYYRLLVLAIPVERKCVDYGWRTAKLSEDRYYLDYTFWNFSEENIDVSIQQVTMIIDNKDTLDISEYFYQTWIMAIPYKWQSRDRYYVLAKNGIQVSFHDIAPILKTEGVYAGKATEYYSDENGFEIPPGTEAITVITTFQFKNGNNLVDKVSTISLEFREGKKSKLLLA